MDRISSRASSGITACAARKSPLLKDALRKLPEMPTIVVMPCTGPAFLSGFAEKAAQLVDDPAALLPVTQQACELRQ